MARLSEKLRACGVVCSGGAGFPTSVKATARVGYVIANGAECEPLVHKDVELVTRFPAEMLSGMRLMMEATGARQPAKTWRANVQPGWVLTLPQMRDLHSKLVTDLAQEFLAVLNLARSFDTLG